MGGCKIILLGRGRMQLFFPQYWGGREIYLQETELGEVEMQNICVKIMRILHSPHPSRKY